MSHLPTDIIAHIARFSPEAAHALFPRVKLPRYTEAHLDRALRAGDDAFALHVLRHADFAVDGYLFDRVFREDLPRAFAHVLRARPDLPERRHLELAVADRMDVEPALRRHAEEAVCETCLSADDAAYIYAAYSQ